MAKGLRSFVENGLRCRALWFRWITIQNTIGRRWTRKTGRDGGFNQSCTRISWRHWAVIMTRWWCQLIIWAGRCYKCRALRALDCRSSRICSTTRRNGFPTACSTGSRTAIFCSTEACSTRSKQWRRQALTIQSSKYNLTHSLMIHCVTDGQTDGRTYAHFHGSNNNEDQCNLAKGGIGPRLYWPAGSIGPANCTFRLGVWHPNFPFFLGG